MVTKAKPPLEPVGTTENAPVYTEQERNEFALQQAELALKDGALQTVVVILIQSHQPAWLVETVLKIREEYGFDNSRFIPQESDQAPPE